MTMAARRKYARLSFFKVDADGTRRNGLPEQTVISFTDKKSKEGAICRAADAFFRRYGVLEFDFSARCIFAYRFADKPALCGTYLEESMTKKAYELATGRAEASAKGALADEALFLGEVGVAA